jgi:hypothetical protein
MKKLAVGAAAFTGLAFAGTGALAIDGCPSGIQSVVTSPDATSYSALFNATPAVAGEVATCTYSMPISTTIPTGNIVVYQARYRGFYDVAAGEDLVVTVNHNGTTDGTIFPGADAADPALLHTNIVASSGGKVTSTTTLDLSNATDAFTIAGFDSADYEELGRITLATDQTAMIAHFSATAELLTGGTQPTEGGNEVGLLGGYGSAMLGATGRYNIAEGFSVLGGLSLLDQSAGATRSTGWVGATAVRYVQPGINSFRPFGEGGLVLGGFQTTHPNAAAAVPTGLGSVFAKGGVIHDLNEQTRVSLFGTLAGSTLTTGAFTQTFPAFSVNVPAQTGYFTMAKITTAATIDITSEVDLTAEASAGTVMSHTGITATIPGIGTVSGTQNNTFMAYGVRLGWEPTEMVRLDAFSLGSTGPDIGTHNMVGVGARLKF